MPATAPERPILFFDGVCNLCNRSVQFIIKQDRQQLFTFASLQSIAGQAAVARFRQENGMVPDSLLLYYKNKYYTYSDAVLHTLILLKGGWRMAALGFIVPRFIRNFIYRFVAGRRYKWFGKRQECMIPTPALKARFLD